MSAGQTKSFRLTLYPGTCVSNDLFPSSDNVPDFHIDGDERMAGNPKSGLPDTGHRKMIRGFGILAWMVVLGLTGYLMFNSLMTQKQQKVTEMARGELLQAIATGKFALGIRELANNPGGQQLDGQARDLLEAIDVGPIEQRFCYAIMVNEFDGAELALEAMDNVRSKTGAINLDYSERQNRLESILTGIFGSLQNDDTPAVTDEDRQYLSDQLPWFGELALNTSRTKSTRRSQLIERAEYSVILISIGVLAGLGMLVIGIIAFFIFVTRILNGSLRHRVVDDSRYGPVYIETFAIWFLLFLGVSLALALQGTRGMSMSTAALTMLLPMAALFWPVFRGVPNQDLLDDVGLRIRNPLVEIAAGAAAYLAMLPMLLVGIIVSVILMGIMSMIQAPAAHEFAPTGVPHPIANEAFNGSLVQAMITIFFVASVLAPLTEEIMFRGVLYRHMRDGSSRMARWASIIFAALFSSLIFAAIHPQGIVGIPVLTTLAFGFCLVRQWRGSLLAPMTMHAIHNGLATSVLIPLLM